MNLGGPTDRKSIRPFLYNLFSDKHIISLPMGIRQALAWLISTARAKKAAKIYEHLGGKSPLLENTQRQQQSLEQFLNHDQTGHTFKVFVAMRYWHPFTAQAVEDVKAFNPDQIVLLPLYPQFSTTTTASSLEEWKKQARRQKVSVPTVDICCYPSHGGFIEAFQDQIRQVVEKIDPCVPYRFLFSAHGVPQKIIDKGDPYESHIHRTVKKIMDAPSFSRDHRVCYQSKVGPTQWLAPSLETALHEAARDKVGVVVVPVSFVSEHSETLVELDIDFSNQARQLKLPFYHRVGTVQDNPLFIKALGKIIDDRLHKKKSFTCAPPFCDPEFGACWRHRGE